MKKNSILLILFLLLGHTAKTQLTIKYPSFLDKSFSEKSNLKLDFTKSKSLSWKWDTITCFNSVDPQVRYTQTFDINGNSLSILLESWTGYWENMLKYSSTYDVNSHVSTYFSQNWIGGAWVDIQKEYFTYDINGNILTDSIYGATMILKESYTYDMNGFKIIKLYEIWENGVWNNIDKYTFTNDSIGNLLVEVYEKWQNGAWVYDSRNTYTYDVNGYISSFLTEKWQINTWTNYSRYSYNNDINGNVLSCLLEEWQILWTNAQKWTTTFGTNISTNIVERWQNNIWENYGQITETYDIEGNLLTRLAASWQNGVWLSSNMLTYNYDVNGNSTNCKSEAWQNNSWQPTLALALRVFSQKVQVYMVDDQLYRYEASFVSFNTRIEQPTVSDNTLLIFPCPAHDFLTIINNSKDNNDKELSIFNIQGQLIFRQTLFQNKSNINISKLDKGVYILKILGKDINLVKKMIKD